jgi:hypothetical protein
VSIRIQRRQLRAMRGGDGRKRFCARRIDQQQRRRGSVGAASPTK